MIYYIYRNKWYYGKMPRGPYYGPILFCQDGDGSKGLEWREVPDVVISRLRPVNEKKSKSVDRLPDNVIRKPK